MVFSLAIAAAGAGDAPEVKEGLWSVHTQTIENPGNKKTEGSFELCRSHAYDQSVRATAKAMKACTMTNESLQGGKYSSGTHCVVGGTTIESKGTTTFQGDTSTHSETHSTYSPAMGGISESTTIMDQKYVGSCPAGMQPGDRKMADGRVVHSGRP